MSIVSFKIAGWLALLFVGTQVLYSCNNTNVQKMSSLNNSLEKSIKNIERNTATVCRNFENKKNEAYASERAAVWEPKIKSIQSISKQLDLYLYKINEELDSRSTVIDKSYKYIRHDADKKPVSDIFYKEEAAKNIYEKIIAYRKQMLAIDTILSKQFNEDIALLFFSGDIKTADDFYNIFFKNTSVISALTVINGFRNEIKNIENETIQFCFFQLPTNEAYFQSSVLVGQNTSHIKAGEIVRIEAGVGAYNTSAGAEININGERVECINGVAVYSLKGQNRPGRYFIPVKIKYIDEMGLRETKEINVEYTVDE